MIFGRMFDAVARADLYKKINIKVSNETLEFTENVKNLGLVIDSRLRFAEHVKVCLQKAYMNLKHIYSIRKFINNKTKILLCDSLVLSQFNFADSVYGPCLDKATVLRIQRVQNACLRLIYGVSKKQHISHKLALVPWLDMETRRYFHSACLFNKIMVNKTPPYLYCKIRYRTDVHNVNIRRKDELTIPAHSHTLFRRCFSYNICHIYASVPDFIKHMPCSAFKRSMRKWLFNQI